MAPGDARSLPIDPGVFSSSAAPIEVEAPGEQAHWAVLHTRSRQEIVVAASAEALGAEIFLPLAERTRLYGHRKRTVQTPLFSCYVFIHAPMRIIFQAATGQRVASILKVVDQPRLERELGHIRGVLARGGKLDPHPYLIKGRSVRVMRGVFRDVEGVVEDRAKLDRIVLQIETLGRAASLEIDPDDVELLE